MPIKTRQQLLDYWNAQLNQNSSNAITGQRLNVGGVDIIESMAMGTDVVGFQPYYVFDKQTNQAIGAIHPLWDEVCNLNYLVEPGPVTLEYKISVTYTYDSASSSVFLRFSIDGGVTWEEFQSEPKDITDKSALFYSFPVQYNNPTGVGKVFLLEAAKEAGVSNLTINFADIIVQRVL